jgi:hypothetical protein
MSTIGLANCSQQPHERHCSIYLRVKRELCHDLPKRSEFSLVVDSSEVVQQLQGSHDGLRSRCV